MHGKNKINLAFLKMDKRKEKFVFASNQTYWLFFRNNTVYVRFKDEEHSLTQICLHTYIPVRFNIFITNCPLSVIGHREFLWRGCCHQDYHGKGSWPCPPCFSW